ncbi:type II secretion system minor pseudopilin GspJ [Sphingomonas immobilis]|uniref:Type II secretion system protein J n=1 Tax=Sphingomonas immobilis TaxID=3063997 RepID=A0ABT8ZUK5_9SPHN|nr:type II secretion system minor pseudopilin GspJ [Sphingomonas sp. CA1-15]MDO7841260.1 type II secretion system minor pseudopilin GspJ [Sphingomonas sp. CA1-15]
MRGDRSLNPLPSREGSREGGFTLIEVMISLMIFGLLAAAGVALLSFSVRAQTATAAKLDDVSALNRLTSVLAADLAQAVNRNSRDTRGDPVAAFAGGKDGGSSPMLRMVRGGWSNLDGARRPGEQKVEYRLADGAIQRVSYPMLDGAQPDAPTAMLGGVRAVALRYRVGGAWSDHWEGSARIPLPEAIELRVVRGDGVPFRALFLVGSGYGEHVDAG